MDWDAIGSIGEVIGATAVLATLVYLSIQTRQANVLARASAMLQIHNQIASHRASVAHDPDLARILLKVEEDVGEELSELDLFRLKVRLQSTMGSFETVYLQYEAGVITLEDFQQIEPVILRVHQDAIKYGAWKLDSGSSSKFRQYLSSRADA